MAATQYMVRGSQRDDLAAICELGSSRLFAIADKLRGAAMTIRQSAIEKIIASEIGAEKAVRLTHVVLGIVSTFRRTLATPERALEQLGRSLGDTRNDSRLQKWDECRPALQAIMETPTISVAAKAIDISYDFERVFLAGRILTSIRPVFDPPRDSIVGTTIVQTLRLEYLSHAVESSDISVAMDLDDIRTLRDECISAIKKAEEAKKRIEADCKIDAIIAGERNDE